MMSPTVGFVGRTCREDTKTCIQNQLLTTSKTATFPAKIDRTSHQMDARRMWLPSKINLAQSHQRRQLCGMANAKWMQRPEVLPRDNWNSKRPFKSDEKECAIHQSQNSTFGNLGHLPTPWKESSRCLHRNIQGTQNHVLRSTNRSIPYTFAMRQQVHHGCGENWQQWGNDMWV